MKGVTIKDALDAIHKTYKKRVSSPQTWSRPSAPLAKHDWLTRSMQADDELTEPYLLGFEWDPEESWTRLKVHLSKNSSVPVDKGGKKKGKKAEKAE